MTLELIKIESHLGEFWSDAEDTWVQLKLELPNSEQMDINIDIDMSFYFNKWNIIDVDKNS